MTPAARARRFYWKRVRRYRYETCGRPNHLHDAITRGCGRPVGVVWHAPSGVWNHVVAGRDVPAEGVAGVLCPACFDRFARERGVILKWEPRPL